MHKRQERINFINKQLRLERKEEAKFTELNDAMREYHEVFGQELPQLPQYLTNSMTESSHLFALSMIGIGGVSYYFER